MKILIILSFGCFFTITNIQKIMVKTKVKAFTLLDGTILSDGIYWMV